MIIVELVIMSGNTKFWYKNGVWHRDNDQPAVIVDDYKEWYQNDVLHRDNNQPSIIRADGSKEWYQKGSFIRSERTQ